MNNHKKKYYFFGAFVALTTVVIFLPALQNEFVNWDDGSYILRNSHIRSFDLSFFKWAFLEFYISNWHPLTWLSHALDYTFWGLNPTGHHLTSVVLHGLNTFLVVLLISRLFETAKYMKMRLEIKGWFLSDREILIAAGTTGLLFGLHPIHVESVAWVSERKDVLCAFFFLLSILFYIRYATKREEVERQKGIVSVFSKRLYLFSLGSFILALMSKPMAVTLPVVLMIIDWYPLMRYEEASRRKAIFIEKLPFFILSLASVALTILAQRSGGAIISLGGLPLSVRIFMGFKSLIVYLWKMILPVKLIPYYIYTQKYQILSNEFLAPTILVIGFTIACIALKKKQKIWLAIWCYYVVTLIPVLGIIQVGSQIMADRYTYLPSVGPFLLIGIGIALVINRFSAPVHWKRITRTFFIPIAFLLIGFMSYLTVKQIYIWKNGIVLWSRIIEINPKVPTAYLNRGDAYALKGYYKEAIWDYTHAINLGVMFFDITINSSYYNRANIYMRLGYYEEALKDYTQAIWLSMKPNFNYYIERGDLYAKLGSYEDALSDYNDAIKLNPKLSGLYFNRGNIYTKLGNLEDALKDYTQAINLSPSPLFEYYKNRAIIYEKLGHSKEAAKDLMVVERLRNNLRY